MNVLESCWVGCFLRRENLGISHCWYCEGAKLAKGDICLMFKGRGMCECMYFDITCGDLNWSGGIKMSCLSLDYLKWTHSRSYRLHLELRGQGEGGIRRM